MSRRVLLSPSAQQDLTEIWQFIANNSVDAADKVIDKIKDAMLSLAEMPGMGHRRQDVRDSRLRFWKVYYYLIAYAHDDQELRVARVVSGHRDFKRLFRR